MAVIDTLEIRVSADSSKAIAELDKLSASLSNLKKNGKFTTLINNLNKLNDALGNTTNTEKIEQLSKSMSRMASVGKSMSPAINAMKKLGQVNLSNVESFNKSNTTMDTMVNKLWKLRKSILSIAVISKIGTLISGAISEMNNYIEANNLFSVSMGSFYEEAYDWANKVNDKLGIDPAEFMKAEGIFMAMARGLGITEEQAYKLSKGMTELSYDLSSFMNIPIEEALTKMKSALAGEIEPLRAVGISVTQATLQEKALALGITENVNAMTDAEKSLLRYKVILDSMKNMGAVGDLAKTIESPANALRILQMQLTQLARAIGSLFIPILTQVLPYIQAFTNVLTKLISKLAVLLGFKMPTWKNSDWNNISDTSGIVADNLDNAKNSAKKMKDYLMGFDELNVIKPDTGTSGGNDNLVSSGLGNLMLEDVWTDAMLDSINTKAKELEETFNKILPVVVAIGVAFATWKIAKGLLNILDILKVGLGVIGGSKTATIASDLLLGEKFTNSMIKIGSLLKKTSIGGLIMGSGSTSLVKTAAALGSVIAAIAALAAGLIIVYNKSENFRNGLKTLLGVLTNTFTSGKKAISKFKGALDNIIPQGLIDTFKKLDLSIGDLLITAGGLLLFGPVGLAIEGVVLAIKGIGYAASDAIKPLDLFGSGISETTKNKVEPFVNSMQDLEMSINDLYLRKIEINMTSAEEINSKVATIRDTIINELDSDKNEALANLDPLKGAMDAESYNALIEKVTNSYNGQIASVNTGTARITEIMNKAAKEQRALTDEEQKEINTIQQTMMETGVKYLSDSETESNLILKRLKDSAVAINTEQTSEIIKNAIDCRDKTIQSAEEQYDKIVLEAQRLYDAGQINEDEYNKIIKAAEDTKNSTIDSANTQYDEIYKTVSTKFPETVKYIDKNTGEIKSRWSVWCDNLASGWTTTWNNIKSTVNEKWNEIKLWFGNNIAPKFTKQYWVDKLKGLKDGFIEVIKNTVNGGINLFNRFIGWLNDKLNISWDGLSILGKEIFPGGSIQLFTIPLIPNVYKEGGFIEDGLFTMNQGEIAGKFNNGKSVVANNEQIISGISQGVYDAFMKALSENDSDKAINVNVYLDSDQITSSVEKNKNSKGLSLFGNELDYNY